MSKIFGIYPIDKSSSTNFLNRINTFMTSHIGSDWHCYKIHFSDEDHIRSLERSKESHFILFMGHGGESELHGACGRYGEMHVDLQATQENPDFYDKGKFIDYNNVGVFRGQILFCFSCNSNRNTPHSLARNSILNGVECFVGFGNIPTDYIEGTPFSKRCIAIYKGIIIKVIKHSLKYAYSNNETIDNVVRIIRILATQEIQGLMLGRDFHGRREVVDQLYKFKNEIKIYGNRYSRIY